MNPKVDFFFYKANKWQDECIRLRTIVLECGLKEELKWGKPCYTFQESNVAIIQSFKEYCALMFFKGALFKDEKRILNKIGENTQASRQIRFANVEEIFKIEKVIKAYIREAIEVEKAGLKVNFKTTAEYKIPGEFQNKLDEIPALKSAFDSLTPGRQRAYLLYFSAPKQSKTREARVGKCMQKVLDGKGLDDQ